MNTCQYGKYPSSRQNSLGMKGDSTVRLLGNHRPDVRAAADLVATSTSDLATDPGTVTMMSTETPSSSCANCSTWWHKSKVAAPKSDAATTCQLNAKPVLTEARELLAPRRTIPANSLTCSALARKYVSLPHCFPRPAGCILPSSIGLQRGRSCPQISSEVRVCIPERLKGGESSATKRVTASLSRLSAKQPLAGSNAGKSREPKTQSLVIEDRKSASSRRKALDVSWHGSSSCHFLISSLSSRRLLYPSAGGESRAKRMPSATARSSCTGK
mmetsp:Transcript_4035/g.8626  ORF Transcript_4035/g.8626 Transcript_4035/m.8626 type:complete len:272 (-) Transcript_4035:367-1182(-)